MTAGPDPSRIFAALDGLEKRLESARQALAAGAEIDLAGLERPAASLCEALLRLEGHDRREAARQLQTVIARLDQLAGALNEARGRRTAAEAAAAYRQGQERR